MYHHIVQIDILVHHPIVMQMVQSAEQLNGNMLHTSLTHSNGGLTTRLVLVSHIISEVETGCELIHHVEVFVVMQELVTDVDVRMVFHTEHIQ